MHSETQLETLKSSDAFLNYISEHYDVDRRGQEYYILCPFHQEDTASCSIYNEKGIWLYYCHGCGAKGNGIQFCQRSKKLNFNKAVETLTEWQKSGEQVRRVFSAPIESKNVTFPLSAMKQAEDALENSKEALKWLAARGISLETAKQSHLGFNQTAESISPNHPWVRDGWILFPTISENKITCVKYRSLKGKRSEDGKISGFLRAPNMTTSAYNMESVIPFDDVFVVEGEMDCLTLQQLGYSTIALPGANYTLSLEERRILMSCPRIFLAGDCDEAGKTAMTKLFNELGGANNKKVFMLEWPESKDANECFLKTQDRFPEIMETLKAKAASRPIPSFYDMAQSLRAANTTKPFDNPSRLRFPWPTVDHWISLLPTDVMVLFATESKTGKSTWLENILLHNAMKYGKVVVNWSAELSPDEYATLVTSYLTEKDRRHLEKTDFEFAAQKMEDVNTKFYNGYQPGATFKDLLRWEQEGNQKVPKGLLVDAKKHLGADIIVIDHLHFLIRGVKDEVAAQAEAMRSIKDFAIQFGVIFIVVAQPRKGTQGTRGRVAQAQDAKGSEAIGSDSSAVFILHRNRISDDSEGSPVFSPETLVKLDYARSAEAQKTKLFFQGNICRFSEMTAAETNMPGGEL